MPLRNRATPLGEIVRDPARGLVYANRGCLHDAHGEIRRRYNGRRWIACRLQFRGWRRPGLLMPGRFTELFFLDEATALAAGHRPCAPCRRADYDHLTEMWRELHPGPTGADVIDAQLHAERVGPDGRARIHPAVAPGKLPDGAFVLHDGEPWLARGDELLRWAPAGDAERRPQPFDALGVITPPSLLALLRSRREPLVPLLHLSAERIY